MSEESKLPRALPFKDRARASSYRKVIHSEGLFTDLPKSWSSWEGSEPGSPGSPRSIGPSPQTTVQNRPRSAILNDLSRRLNRHRGSMPILLPRRQPLGHRLRTLNAAADAGIEAGSAGTGEHEPSEKQQQTPFRQVEEVQQSRPRRGDVVLWSGRGEDRHGHDSAQHERRRARGQAHDD